jgi:hypothetical protein
VKREQKDESKPDDSASTTRTGESGERREGVKGKGEGVKSRQRGKARPCVVSKVPRSRLLSLRKLSWGSAEHVTTACDRWWT